LALKVCDFLLTMLKK